MGSESARSVDEESARQSDVSGRVAQPYDVTFSLAGARDGFLECLPIALGVAGYGVVFGVLATRAGLSVAEATLMSATVLAGAAQLIAVELWAESVPTATVVLTTLLVNLRYVLMGAALRPWLAERSPLEAYGSVFFTADENWALTVRAFSEEASARVNGAYLLGSGLAIWFFWVAATIVGAVAGDGISDPSRYGLDVVFVAVFVALAVELWDGTADLGPWTAAFVVALASAHAFSGRWYLLTGALAGCLVGVLETDGDSSEVGT